jgi:hypothetical protein
MRFDGLRELDRPLVLAAAAAKLVVRARARRFGGVDDVSACGLRLGRDKPGHASDVLDPLVPREKASAFLPKVRVRRVHGLNIT